MYISYLYIYIHYSSVYIDVFVYDWLFIFRCCSMMSPPGAAGDSFHCPPHRVQQPQWLEKQRQWLGSTLGWSNQKNRPWLFRVFLEDEILPIYGGDYFINDYKDPNCWKIFLLTLCVLCFCL